MENNSTVISRLTEALYEEMRQLNIKNENPQLQIEDFLDTFKINSSEFNNVYMFLKDTGVIKEIKRNGSIITFEVLK